MNNFNNLEKDAIHLIDTTIIPNAALFIKFFLLFFLINRKLETYLIKFQYIILLISTIKDFNFDKIEILNYKNILYLFIIQLIILHESSTS